MELLTRFELGEAAGRAVKTYSGGMRRRLDLAASLVGEPLLLYLDEPTTGLDVRSRLELWDLVRSLVADGVTVLLTTQYLEEADALANEIVVIEHGKVIATGTPDELKARVGAQSLEVKPAREADILRAASMVGAVTGADPDVRGHLVTAPVTAGPEALQAMVRRLDEEGIAISELSLRSSSLDEVFLALTGHPTEQSERYGKPAEAVEETSA